MSKYHHDIVSSLPSPSAALDHHSFIHFEDTNRTTHDLLVQPYEIKHDHYHAHDINISNNVFRELASPPRSNQITNSTITSSWKPKTPNNSHPLLVAQPIVDISSRDIFFPEEKKPRGRICSVAGCTRGVRSRNLCKGHGGGRRCSFPSCGLSDQGGGFCISHGGGKRCVVDGCTNSSQSRGLCKKHGGGTRCSVDGCTKSSQGGGKCRTHGGGNRCKVEGCNKTDRRGGLCIVHGVDRKCKTPQCSKTGRNQGYCATHFLLHKNSL